MTDEAVSNVDQIEWNTDRLRNFLTEAVPLVEEDILGRLEMSAPAGSAFRLDARSQRMRITSFGPPANGSIAARVEQGQKPNMVDSFAGNFCAVDKLGGVVILTVVHRFDDLTSDSVSVLPEEATISVELVLDDHEAEA